MRPELETYELIDKYLNKKLSGEELTAFETKIKSDASFQELVEQQQLVNEVVAGAHFNDLRSKMTQDIAAFDKGKATKIKWWTGSMLGLMILGGTGYLLSEKATAPKTEIVSEQTVAKKQEEPFIPAKKEDKTTPLTKEVYKRPGKQNQKNTDSKETDISEDPYFSKSQDAEPVEPASDPGVIAPPAEVEPVNPFYSPPATENTRKVNCDEVRISVSPQVQATCKGEAEGSIIIYGNKIKGGIAPYAISLNESDAHSNREVFANLEAGHHLLTIKDKSGCVTRQEVVIPEKDCPKMNKFAIQPDLGEVWNLPAHGSQSGTFSIYTGNGLLVYKADFGHGETAQWNGTDRSGSLVNAGVYIYIIEYSGGKKENGQITVSR